VDQVLVGPLDLLDPAGRGVTAIGTGGIVAAALAHQPAGAPALDPLLPGFISLEYAVLAVGVLVAFTTFFLVQAVQSGHHLGVSLSRPGVPGAVLADGIILFVVALMGLGLGAIIRHTAGGITALVALIILPAILALLPAPGAAGSAGSPCWRPRAR
jgi:ABC-2 type transport system permease protein